MDSHQPADPWEIPAAPVDEGEPTDPSDTGSVLVEDDVTAAPQHPAPTAADRAAEPPVPLPEEPTPEPPTDEVPVTASDEDDPAPEAVEVEVPEMDTGPVEVVDEVDDVAVESTAGAEPGEEPTPEPAPTPAPPRFDLGLDEEPAEPWGGEGQTFESGTAFDLVRPAPDEDPEPEYEVSEPDLSETFVSTAGSGRPDLSAPQLTDPAPMFSVPEDQLDTLPETADAAAEDAAAAPEAGEHHAEESEAGEQSSGFRLPGLSVFGRRKAAEPTPDEDAVPEELGVEVGDAVTLEEASTPEDTREDVEPPVPSAWAETAPVGTSDPGSPFAEPPSDPFVDETPATDETESIDPVDEAPEPSESVAESVVATEPVADAAEPVEPAAEAPEPVHEPVVEEVEPMEPMEPTEPVATEPVEEPSSFVPPAARKPVFDEDHPAIELTEPDLTEALDAPELYVTETASQEDRPPALLTVDSVPGATIAQAVDVVTAVASAANEVEIADALDRTMAQLRERATQLGGEAVISVHTEVQEIGGGFLVIASGTAVTLA